MSVKLCRPKEDFIYEQEYVNIGEPITESLPFLYCEIYAFTKERAPIISFIADSVEYVDRICVFYPRNSGSELIRFSLEEFNQKFTFESYTSW